MKFSKTAANKPNPVILAGGEGQRLGLHSSPKPMVHIDAWRPVIGTIVYRLLGLGYGVGDIGVVVGHKSEAIIDYLGSGFLYCEQSSLGSPAQALEDWVEKYQLSKSVLAIHGDDGEWLTRKSYTSLLQDYDNHQLPVMSLTTNRDVDTHKINFQVAPNRNICRDFNANTREGYISGAFCIDVETFKTTHKKVQKQNNGNEIGLVTVYKNMIDSNDTARGVLENVPWKSINTLEGLFAARSLHSAIIRS